MNYMSRQKVMSDKINIKPGSTVYVIQEIPGTQSGSPKINIMGASKYGELKILFVKILEVKN